MGSALIIIGTVGKVSEKCSHTFFKRTTLDSSLRIPSPVLEWKSFTCLPGSGRFVLILSRPLICDACIKIAIHPLEVVDHSLHCEACIHVWVFFMFHILPKRLKAILHRQVVKSSDTPAEVGKSHTYTNVLRREEFNSILFNSIQFLLYSRMSQITNLPQRALQSVHLRHP